MLARYLQDAENRKWRKTCYLPSGSLKSAKTEFMMWTILLTLAETQRSIFIWYCYPQGPQLLPPNPLLLLQNIPFNLQPRFPWLQFTCDSHNICLILKFMWQLFEIPGTFSTFSPSSLKTPRGWRKLISCLKMQDDSRSKVKPIYKGNCCQCLEKSVFIWKIQWSTWLLVSHGILLWKSFNL